jgi:hypothetical protein
MSRALKPMREPFSCWKNMSEIAAAAMASPTGPPNPMTIRQAKACANECELATPMAPAIEMRGPMRRTGRRPIRRLRGIQNRGARALKIVGADPIYVAVEFLTWNSFARVSAAGDYNGSSTRKFSCSWPSSSKQGKTHDHRIRVLDEQRVQSQSNESNMLAKYSPVLILSRPYQSLFICDFEWG